ncbi:MAG: DUF4835 family protein [Flavobacteriales bacterium]|nr:DUF4835 family protein [Flavobacteriales bacterium]
MINKIVLIFFVFFYSSSELLSQEVLCNVRVIPDKEIQISDRQKLQTLQKSVREFVNNRKWTNEVFTEDERIEFNISFNILSKVSTDRYAGTLQVQYSRPIFNSSYYSPILNYLDDEIEFDYIETQPLDYNENTHESNLSAILSYYTYIIIGLDYSTFSSNAGNVYLQKAKKIVENAQSAPEGGWKAFESNKNRYWLAEELLDAKYSSFHDVLYNYHRQGLDIMNEDNEKGRGYVTESIESMRKIKQLNPTAFILQLFFNSKADEISNIYSNAYQEEKNRVYKLLSELDPANLNKYNKIKEKNSINALPTSR